MTDPDPLAAFHPAVRGWFERRFAGGPTEAQSLGWASIAAGNDTLIAAPTGSGKTLAGFLVAIDRCYRAPAAAAPAADGSGTEVVYVSPLRALTVDIRENLEGPLKEIAALAGELGTDVPDVRVAVRNGDTPPSARAAMLRHPPQIVVTTPESLYLLLTTPRGRAMLSTVRTVIVDEIHALARDKRGSHLALSLERLERCCTERPVRIGLSATQRPVETVARLLVGAGPARSQADGTPACTVVDTGHRRALDVAIELPDDEMGAVATNEQFDQVLEIIASYVRAHRTTLVFVNTRRLSERVAHVLGEKIGDDRVAAHHGSLSTERRLRVEGRLRAGDLSALVATASLELGIDVGPVDLVCQLGSPRSIATFLQRVGRAEHRLSGVPKGRLFPLTRDELVESVSLLAAVRAGELDRVHPPVAPLDILAQQLVAEVAACEDGCPEAEMYEMARQAAPYAGLSREAFEEIVDLASEGVTTGRGRRGAHLHRDQVNGALRARRGARLAALTSGGAIPEVADYRVVQEPGETFIGTVNEDWAIESMAGDTFLLGSHSWRIRRVETGVVRVVDAEGAPPSVPFWLGEAPARTEELADAVSMLRAGVGARLGGGVAPASVGTAGAVVGAGGAGTGEGAGIAGEPAVAGAESKVALREAEAWVVEVAGVSERVAAELVAYLAAGYLALGVLPTKDDVVFERFFDDTGGMQLVVHAPFGGRVNRGLGLALRKRFCRSFDFELQAAANDDAVVLSLGPQHSFPLADVARFLSPATIEEVLSQAVLATPMFTARWRWNLTRSLVQLRSRGGKRVPPAIQRMESDDLMAAIFPALAACQENTTGAIELPDHPIVRQTMHDCLTEAMDVEGLERLLEGMRGGAVRTHFRDTVEPSLLSHEILNGRPYTFLDGAPLEERRTRAVQLRRGIPLEEHDLTALDPDAVAQVRAEAKAAPRDPDELHDLLLSVTLLSPEPEFEPLFAPLVTDRRAMRVAPADGTAEALVRWCAAERRGAVEALWPGAQFTPDLPAVAGVAAADAEDATAAAVRGHLEILGPMTVAQLASLLAIGTGEVDIAVARLETEGFLLRGVFDRPAGGAEAAGPLPEQVCARRLLARAHGLHRDRQRKSIEPASSQSMMRFLLAWQHVAPGTRLLGPGGVVEVVGQLQGFELAVGAWEKSVLPARISGYHAALLDGVCQSGEVAWGRLAGRPVADAVPRRAGSTPSRATPLTLVRREDLPWLIAAVRRVDTADEPLLGATEEVIAMLRERGALFFSDLCDLTRRLAGDVAGALWDGVARGLVTADGFQAVRSLLGGNFERPRPTIVTPGAHRALPPAMTGRPRRPGVPRPRVRPALSGGRWSLLSVPEELGLDADELAEAEAGQLLGRWGVVFRDLLVREQLALPWRDVLFALRRLEARGLVRGGRFVAGFQGEQFALPEAVDALRRTHKTAPDGTTVTLSATDPLNLVGTLVPGPRVPAVLRGTVTLRDGVYAGDAGTEVADAG